MLLEQQLVAELIAEWNFKGHFLLLVFVVFSKM